MRHARPPVNNHGKTPAATPPDGPPGRPRTVEGLVIQGTEPGPQRPAGRFIQCLLATSIAYTQTSRPRPEPEAGPRYCAYSLSLRRR